MKKITTDAGKFGPYKSVEVLEDRYRVDGPSDLPFTVVGQGEITNVIDGDFPPPPYVEPEPLVAPVVIAPTKEELMAELAALTSKIEALA